MVLRARGQHETSQRREDQCRLRGMMSFKILGESSGDLIFFLE